MRAIESVEIDLGGRKRPLYFTHRVLRRAEVELNKSRMREGWTERVAIETAINRAIRTNFPHDLTEILLWAGLVDDDPSLRPDTIGDVITDRLDVVKKLIEAVTNCYPRPEPDAAPEVGDTAAPFSNGSTSGASDASG